MRLKSSRTKHTHSYPSENTTSEHLSNIVQTSKTFGQRWADVVTTSRVLYWVYFGAVGIQKRPYNYITSKDLTCLWTHAVWSVFHYNIVIIHCKNIHRFYGKVSGVWLPHHLSFFRGVCRKNICGHHDMVGLNLL